MHNTVKMTFDPPLRCNFFLLTGVNLSGFTHVNES